MRITFRPVDEPWTARGRAVDDSWTARGRIWALRPIAGSGFYADVMRLRPRTIAVSAGRPTHEPGAAVNHPIGASTTFVQGSGLVYSRQDESRTDALAGFEETLGLLEGGRVTAFSSGMAASTAVFETLPVGAGVVLPTNCYYSNQTILQDAGERGRLRVAVVDTADTDATIEAMDAVGECALIWLESPSNPMLRVCDLPAIAEAAHERGALVAVDSTFNTPFVLRPLEQGADLVVHSATKYIGGHSDLLMGVVVAKRDDLIEAIRSRRYLGGAMPGTLETFLALRGLRTLPLRMAAAQDNAAELARRLQQHPSVAWVRYLGLPEDEFHERARVQQDGFGAVLTFGPVGGAPAADAVCEAVRLITPATSLGGVETLLERRAKYAGDRDQGVPDDLLRLSVGIEDVEDLWDDLARALDGIG